jgi:hypothetical protein
MNEENKDSKLPVASSIGIATAAVLIGNLGESVERNRLLQAISDSRNSKDREAAQEAFYAFEKKSNDMLALEFAFYKFAAALIVLIVVGATVMVVMSVLFDKLFS